MINIYRKKPVEIEAVQYTGNNTAEVIYFAGKNCSCEKTDIAADSNVSIVINTLEGKMLASVGDYIIKGINGEFYPCKPDIFEKTYDQIF